MFTIKNIIYSLLFIIINILYLIYKPIMIILLIINIIRGHYSSSIEKQKTLASKLQLKQEEIFYLKRSKIKIFFDAIKGTIKMYNYFKSRAVKYLENAIKHIYINHILSNETK